MQNDEQVRRGLEEIAGLLAFAGEARFRVKAYERAAEIVRTVGNELGDVIERGRLTELEGIGPALSGQIHELWNTGSSAYLARLRTEHPEGAAELVQIEGMTPRRIRALHAALDIRSVADLRAACQAERVRGVAGFGKKTEARLCAACERWLSRGAPEPRRLLLPRALELADELRGELLEVAPHVVVAGALRRGEETLTELDLVVVGDRARALARLAASRRIVRVAADTATAYTSEGVPVKLHIAGERELGMSLLAATGTAAHVRAVRELLARSGNDAGAWASEGELYAALGLPFIPPELRVGGAELTRAAAREYADLVDVDAIRGAVHCHTNYSDGKNSVLEMAEAAQARGLSYITITDHSPSAHYAGGVTLDRLKQQWDEIAAVQQRVPIRILRGTESDILADGALDYPDEVLERFDVVIASIHARHRLDRAKMTDRLVRALSLPMFKIWGHALGRILLHRPAIECDVPRVLDALASARGAIEISADPHRLDLPPAWIPAARERAIPFVISVDAHSTRGLDVLRYGILMARRGGVRRGEVLNARSADDFARCVKPR